MIARLDLVSLKLFVDVVEAGTIGKGAERNFIAVSAASKRIAEVEHTLGAQLLTRHARGVSPTRAGMVLYRGAQEALARLQRVAADVSGMAENDRQHVRFYANLTAMVCYLPDALLSFGNAYPGIKVDLHEQSSLDTLRAISRGEADIGIVARVVPYPEELHCVRFDSVQLVVVANPRHVLANRNAVNFEQAAEHDFVGLGNEGALDKLLSKYALEQGSAFNVRVRVQGFDGMCRMIAGDLGIGIMPAPVAQQCAQSLGLKILALEEPWAEVALDLCTRTPTSIPDSVRLLRDHLLGLTRGYGDPAAARQMQGEWIQPADAAEAVVPA